MLDIGWTELLVIGALALIVVGPRDLPQLLRTVGQAVGKIKRMAREFQRSMEDAARETDLANFKEMRDLKKDMGSFDFRAQAAKAQSYMNKPVTPGATDVAGGAAAGAAAAAAGAPDPSTAAPSPAAEAPVAPTPAPEPGARPAAPAAPSAAAPSAAAGTAGVQPEAGPSGDGGAPEGAAPRRAGAQG